MARAPSALLSCLLILCLLSSLALSRDVKENGKNKDKNRAKVAMANGHQRRKGKLLIRADPSKAMTANALSVSSLTTLGLKRRKSVGSAGWMLVDIDAKDNATAKMNQLKKLGYKVEYDYVVRTLKVPSDRGWSNIAAAMNLISAPKAWNTFTGRGDVKVCVIDTGIAMSHVDLKMNYVTSYNAITNRESYYAGFDDSIHGTHCSGTIGGVGNNRIGVAGVSWKVKLYACKFIDSDGNGFTADATECVRWCRNKGAKITSNSWGGGGYSQSLVDEIRRSRDAGHLFIAAAGNDAMDNDWSMSYPSSFSLSNIIAVGAVDSRDNVASFSNYGATTVDLFAPGVRIFSTIPGSYKTLSGTSMACPHVAGAAALVWSYRPKLTAAQVKRVLLLSVDRVSALRRLCVTGGRLNVAKALQLAAKL